MRQVARLTLVAMIATVALLSPAAIAGQTPRALLDIAADAMTDASNAPSETERNAALRRALAAYRTIESEHGRASEPLHVAAAAAAMLLGDTGTAVLQYRRALRVDPTSARAREGLRAARAGVGTAPPVSVGDRLLRATLAWKAWVRPGVVLWLGAAAWTLVFALWAARVALGWRVPRWPAAALVIVCGSLLGLDAAADLRPAGVIVADDAVAYLGPSVELFEPAFAEPLEPGVEFRVIERTDGWWRIAVGGAGDAWIRADLGALVDPAR